MKIPAAKLRQSRTVRLDLDQETVESILADWARANVPEFEGLKVEVSICSGYFEGCRFSCEVTGKSDEAT